MNEAHIEISNSCLSVVISPNEINNIDEKQLIERYLESIFSTLMYDTLAKIKEKNIKAPNCHTQLCFFLETSLLSSVEVEE